MLASFLLSLREGIEAALIIGIVLGALRKLNRSEMAPAVWYGTLSAILVSLITGVLLTVFGLSLQGAAEQIFEGGCHAAGSRCSDLDDLLDEPSVTLYKGRIGSWR